MRDEIRASIRSGLFNSRDSQLDRPGLTSQLRKYPSNMKNKVCSCGQRHQSRIAFREKNSWLRVGQAIRKSVYLNRVIGGFSSVSRKINRTTEKMITYQSDLVV